MKIMKKIGVILLSICLVVPLFGVISYAASGKISISSTSGNVGSTVTVKCTVTSQSGAIGSADVVLTYDQSALQYVSGSDGTNGGAGRVQYVAATTSSSATSLSFSMKFKILKQGSSTISSAGVEAYTLDEQLMSVSGGSGKVTGKVPQVDNRDTNNKLSSLQVAGGVMTPEFSAGTTAYTVTVPEDTTDVTISAAAQSSKATVTVSGGKELRLGANTATVTVTAENDSVLTYVLTIMCGEAEKISVGETEYTINHDFTDDQIPAGFTRTKVTYNQRQYEALVNGNSSLNLVSLQNEAGATFYIYNQTTQEFYNFVQISIAEGKYVIPMPLNDEVAEFAEHDKVLITVQGKEFDAWKLNDEFSVIQALNQDGAEVLYRYDSVDGTFQRYVEIEEKEPVVEEKTIFPSTYYMYAIVGLGGLVLILSIAMIYFVASRKGRHEGRKKKALKKIEKQKAKEEKQLEKQRKKEEKAMK